MTNEALRRVPEGAVYACTRTLKESNALQEQFALLPELMRPIVLSATLTELPTILSHQAPDVLFDRMLGRNALMYEVDKLAIVKQLVKLLRPSGILVLAETVPRQTQRLYHLVDRAKLNIDLSERLVAAEEAI